MCVCSCQQWLFMCFEVLGSSLVQFCWQTISKIAYTESNVTLDSVIFFSLSVSLLKPKLHYRQFIENGNCVTGCRVC